MLHSAFFCFKIILFFSNPMTFHGFFQDLTQFSRALHNYSESTLYMSLLWSHVRESGLRNMENFCLWDPESGKTKLLGDGQNRRNWNQEYSSRNLESL